ncbi:DNA-3-methyladenine glycosylase [Oceanicaulis sp. MMSF_3324]|uniref:DNA-3-methyladenine glycosylase family protein n=1 Tax=Oceanicaulis sp. MMSF_3324 TaxID=3046702 RepID=UPI00273D223C|nr:DNA-3-methyladenine glycosylase 2 family protein [Oceanicaulis sp. MMSF_3324]
MSLCVDPSDCGALDSVMTQDVHDHCLDVAAALSPDLHAAIARQGALPHWSSPSAPFPVSLSRSVAGQQLSVKAAASIWKRVEALSDAPDGLLEVFTETQADRMRACGLSGAKVKTLIAIAEAQRQGLLDEAVLQALSPQERSDRLIDIWGVGRWTADMANIFYFQEPDIWPDGDVTARKTLEKLTSKRRKTVRTAARFAPCRSYLARYMWRHADAPPDM